MAASRTSFDAFILRYGWCHCRTIYHLAVSRTMSVLWLAISLVGMHANKGKRILDVYSFQDVQVRCEISSHLLFITVV